MPKVDMLADQVLNGSGKFTARVLYVQPTTRAVTPRDLMPIFQNLQTGQTYSGAGALKTVTSMNSWAGNYYIYRYTLAVPAGSYKLVSPTTTFVGATVPGWKINSEASLEGWSLKDALVMSEGSYLGQQGYIEVTADAYGRAYGYWGGQWLDLSINS